MSSFIPFSASTGQVWSLDMALQVQSAPQGSLCCLTRTASVSSGWSWSRSACTAVWQISWPTHTPQTWSGLRPCCATCSHGLPDASLVGALATIAICESPLFCADNVTITIFILSVLPVFQAHTVLLCNLCYFIDLIPLTATKWSQTYCSIIAGDINLFYLCMYLFIFLVPTGENIVKAQTMCLWCYNHMCTW